MIFERWRTYRRVQRTPDLSPGTPEGEVARATGVVRALDKTVVSAYSGRVCVAWRVRMFHAGGRDEHIRGRFEASDLVPFALDRADGTSVEIHSIEARYDLLETPDPRIYGRWAEYCDERGISSRAPASEITLVPGDKVSVVGIVAAALDVRPPREEVGYRDTGAPSLMLTGDFDRPVLIARVRSA